MITEICTKDAGWLGEALFVLGSLTPEQLS